MAFLLNFNLCNDDRSLAKQKKKPAHTRRVSSEFTKEISY